MLSKENCDRINHAGCELRVAGCGSPISNTEFQIQDCSHILVRVRPKKRKKSICNNFVDINAQKRIIALL